MRAAVARAQTQGAAEGRNRRIELSRGSLDVAQVRKRRHVHRIARPRLPDLRNV